MLQILIFSLLALVNHLLWFGAGVQNTALKGFTPLSFDRDTNNMHGFILNNYFNITKFEDNMY